MKHALHTNFFPKAFRRALIAAAVIAPLLCGAQHNTNMPQYVYTSGSTFVYGMPFASPDPMGQRVQLIYRPAELKARTGNTKAPGGKISRIYLRTAPTATGSFTMSNVFVKLGQTSDTGYVANNIGESPFLSCTEVFRQVSYKVSAPGWIEFTLAQPFQYDNTKNLVVEIGGTNGFRPVINSVNKRMIFGAVGSANGANINFLHDLGFDLGTGGATAVPVPQQTTVSVYPNPAMASIHVQGAGQEATLTLRDAGGRVVLSSRVAGAGQVPVRHLSPGLYFYTLYGRQQEPLGAGRISIVH